MTFSADKFYDLVRHGRLLGPTLESSEFQGLDAILQECVQRGWGPGWTAYALATAYHETSHTMQPIHEMGGPKYLTRMYDIQGTRPTLAKTNGNTSPGDGVKYCGRGFVQLTWKSNYAKAEKKLGIDGLVKNPDLAMNVTNAAKILGSGMEEGWFSGVGLKKYIPNKTDRGTHDQFGQCRHIINGTDKASLIADYAMSFQADLIAGGL